MLLPGSIAIPIPCSLELRVPFLVHQLVEIALPMAQRFHRPGKGLRRQVCAGLFSSCSLHRTKESFVLPRAGCINQQLQGFGDRAWSLVALAEFA
jgi:hypothetical protein